VVSLRQQPGRLLTTSTVTLLLVGLAAVMSFVAPGSLLAAGPGDQSDCPEGTIADIQPQDAIIARLHGRDARIFIESCLAGGPTAPTPAFDKVLILSGPDVMGGTVAVIAQDQCPVGHQFLGLMEFIHANEMVLLFQRHPALQSVEHLDLGVLTDLAQHAGEPAAAFHVGFAKAMGRGTPRDRAGSIDWLRRAAEAHYTPGMLGLGMALAGPGVIDEQVLPVGRQRPRDAQTDLVQACYWLKRTAAMKQELSSVAGSVYRDEVEPRLTPDEKKACRALLVRGRKGG